MKDWQYRCMAIFYPSTKWTRLFCSIPQNSQKTMGILLSTFPGAFLKKGVDRKGPQVVLPGGYILIKIYFKDDSCFLTILQHNGEKSRESSNMLQNSQVSNLTALTPSPTEPGF